MNTPLVDDHASPNDTTDAADIEDDEPYVRLPIDPAEPMATWLAII